MNDSIFITVCKSIGAVIGACILGWIFKFLLLFAYAWFMDFNLFSFFIIGKPLLLIIALIPIGGSVFLSKLFNNRVAGGIFSLIITIWLVITIIQFWIFVSNLASCDSEWFKASVITLLMASDIFGLLVYSFTQAFTQEDLD